MKGVEAIWHISLDYPPNTQWGVGNSLAPVLGELSSSHPVGVITRSTPMAYERAGLSLIRPNFYRFNSDPFVDAQFLFNPFLRNDTYLYFEPLMAWNLIMQREIAAALQDYPPVVIHNHSWMTQPLASSLRRTFGVPLINSIHFLESQYAYSGESPTAPDLPDIMSLEQDIIASSDVLVTPSDWVDREIQRSCIGNRAPNIQVVPHGVAMPRFSGRSVGSDGACRVLFVGRFVTGKGVQLLCQVANDIIQDHPSVSFTLAGDGPLFAELKARFECSRIRFPGRLTSENLGALYSESDIFVLPSVTETFGLAVLEAMSYGLAVLTTSGERISRLVDNGITGIAIPVESTGAGATGVDRELLHETLVKLITNSELRTYLGENARMSVEMNFTHEQVAGRLMSIYRPLFSGTRPAKP